MAAAVELRTTVANAVNPTIATIGLATICRLTGFTGIVSSGSCAGGRDNGG